MTTRTIVEYAGTVEPQSLSEQVVQALEDADSQQLAYVQDSFDLTRFETDVQNPLLATVEGEAMVHFYGHQQTRARVVGEFRRESGDLEAEELETAEVYLKVREFDDTPS